MINSLKKIVFKIVYFISEALSLSEIVKQYQIASLRKKLKHSFKGLQIEAPFVINHAEKVSIGKDCSIAAFLHVWGGGGVTIGARVLIASHVSIISETHDYNIHPMGESAVRKPITIGDDVWLGTHCTILPGVTVGRGAVIGAGAVVTKDVEPFSINVGVPARKMGERDQNAVRSLKACRAGV